MKEQADLACAQSIPVAHEFILDLAHRLCTGGSLARSASAWQSTCTLVPACKTTLAKLDRLAATVELKNAAEISCAPHARRSSHGAKAWSPPAAAQRPVGLVLRSDARSPCPAGRGAGHACSGVEHTHLVDEDDGGREPVGEAEEGAHILLALAEPLGRQRRHADVQEVRAALRRHCLL